MWPDRYTAMHDSLRMALAVAVPLAIADLKQHEQPLSKWHLERARNFATVLGSRGDVLLFGSKKVGEAAELFTELAASLAVLAFQPGGCTFLGEHWEANDERADPGDSGLRTEHGDEDQPAQLEADSVEG